MRKIDTALNTKPPAISSRIRIGILNPLKKSIAASSQDSQAILVSVIFWLLDRG